MPNNNRGSVYIAHEPRKGDEQCYELIGGKASNEKDPKDTIALDEVFSYRVNVEVNLLTVTIIRSGKPDIVKVGMSNGRFHKSNQYMYFKAGAYNQNNTAGKNDSDKLPFIN